MDVSGVALVIGASGIGKACSLALARYGARGLVIADLSTESAQELAIQCKASARNAAFGVEAIGVDVTLEESVNNAMQHAVETFGRIDYCVNCAGVGVQQANEIAEASVEEFNDLYKVNAMGTFLVTRAISAVMKRQEPLPNDTSFPARGVTRGSIVNVGSASAFVATPRMVQYTTAKHAALGITKNAALDNAAYGIRVNSVCPSWVDTPMIGRALKDVPGLEEMINSAVPLGRIAVADEVADAVIFFCSPISSYATGCNMIMDGGTTLASHHL